MVEENGVAKDVVCEQPPTTAIVKSESSAITKVKSTTELSLAEAAKALQTSGLVKANEKIGQLYAKLELGRSLGLSDVAALTGLNITEKGSILVSAAVLQLLIKISKRYKVRVPQRDIKGAKVEIYEYDPHNNAWESCGVPICFGPEDAKRAGLDSRDTYKKWPIDMYFNRALAAAFRTYCADCMQGVSMYLPEEIDRSGFKTEVTTGEMVEEADYEVKPAKKTKNVSDVDKILKLVEETGSDLAVMLKHFEVESLENMKVEQLAELESLLVKKKKVAAKK